MASHKIAQVVRKSQALGPSVRNLLSQYHLDLTKITSSGPHQTVLKSDVLNYIQQRNLKQTEQAQPKKQQMIKTSSQSTLDFKYSRKYPTEFEIEVINSGGVTM